MYYLPLQFSRWTWICQFSLGFLSTYSRTGSLGLSDTGFLCAGCSSCYAIKCQSAEGNWPQLAQVTDWPCIFFVHHRTRERRGVLPDANSDVSTVILVYVYCTQSFASFSFLLCACCRIVVRIWTSIASLRSIIVTFCLCQKMMLNESKMLHPSSIMWPLPLFSVLSAQYWICLLCEQLNNVIIVGPIANLKGDYFQPSFCVSVCLWPENG